MPRASEDSIESLIDDVVLVRPKTEFPLGIHARMHAGRQQARAETRKPFKNLPIKSLLILLKYNIYGEILYQRPTFMIHS